MSSPSMPLTQVLQTGDRLAGLVGLLYQDGVYFDAVRAFRKEWIRHALIQARGNECSAARALGMHRNTLGRLVGDLGLNLFLEQLRQSRGTSNRTPHESAGRNALTSLALSSESGRLPAARGKFKVGKGGRGESPEPPVTRSIVTGVNSCGVHSSSPREKTG